MNLISSTQFKKDYKKVCNNKQIVESFIKAVTIIIERKKLPEEFKEHTLSGDMKGITDIHLYPDTLLLFRIDYQKDELHLLRIGSHSSLFG